jgi:hypothetical protein
MGWTLSPSLADLGPSVMSYLYSHASSGPFRDVFVAGVSGMGYFYPDLSSDANLATLAAQTAAYMGKADMGVGLAAARRHGAWGVGVLVVWVGISAICRMGCVGCV